MFPNKSLSLGGFRLLKIRTLRLSEYPIVSREATSQTLVHLSNLSFLYFTQKRNIFCKFTTFPQCWDLRIVLATIGLDGQHEIHGILGRLGKLFPSSWIYRVLIRLPFCLYMGIQNPNLGQIALLV